MTDEFRVKTIKHLEAAKIKVLDGKLIEAMIEIAKSSVMLSHAMETVRNTVHAERP